MFHNIIIEMIDTSFRYQVVWLMGGEERSVGRAESKEADYSAKYMEVFADEKAALCCGMRWSSCEVAIAAPRWDCS